MVFPRMRGPRVLKTCKGEEAYGGEKRAVKREEEVGVTGEDI